MPGYAQRIDYEEHADGSVTARLTLSLPDGGSKRFVHTLTPEELLETAVLLAGHEVPEVGAEMPKTAADFTWQSGAAKQVGKSVTDRKAMEKWWAGLASETRQRMRATYAAIVAVAPKGLTPTEYAVWWERQGVGRRKALRKKYGGYGGGVLDDVSSALGSVADVIGPLASSVAKQVPGYGPVIAAGIDDASKYVRDPKKAAVMAMGGLGALQIVDRLAPSGARKQVAATKVLQSAAEALAGAGGKAGLSPHLAKGASAVLGTAAALASAELANSAGAPRTAQKMIDQAKARALKLSGSPAVARVLLRTASTTRTNVAKAATKSDDVLARARKGQVRSTRGGKVTAAELQRAAAGGRLFFVS